MAHRYVMVVLGMLLYLADAHSQVLCGIDVLSGQNFQQLQNKRVVLVTHAAARTAQGITTTEAMLAVKGVRVLRLLAPEHGFYGVVPAGKEVTNDTIFGLVALSLYGSSRRPSASMLASADVCVVDMQDIGARSYTYISTMMEVMEACASNNVPLMILDRPNPLGGSVVDGNLPDDTVRSFITRLPVPYVHGMTMGELATMANESGWLEKGPNGKPRRCSLSVIRCNGWQRSMTWEQTGRTWYPTSPNIPTIASVRGYVLTGLLGELGIVSIGIGTATPFWALGLPDYGRDTILEKLLHTFGVDAQPARFKPNTGAWANAVCSGYYLTAKTSWQPYNAALSILWRSRRRFPQRFESALAAPKTRSMFLKACGSAAIIEALLSNTAEQQQLFEAGKKGLDDFRKKRAPYLLY